MKFIKDVIKKYFSSFTYFYRFLGYKLFVVIGLSILVGALDAFGLTMFFPILELADGSESASGGGMPGMETFILTLEQMGIQLTLIVALGILMGFFLLKGITTYFVEIYKVLIRQKFIADLRIKLTRLFKRYSYKAFVGADVGHIQNSFTSEMDRLTGAFMNYANGIHQIFMTFIYMIFVFLIDWKFALLVCLGGGLTNIIYKIIYKRTKEESVVLSQEYNNYHNLVIQYIGNFKYLKATGSISTFSTKLIKSIKKLEDAYNKIGFLNAQILSSREPLLILVVCIVIIIQVYAFGGKLATILMSLLLFYRALQSLINFQNFYNAFLGYSGSLENVKTFEKQLNESIEKDGNVQFEEFKNKIEIENLNFGYKNSYIFQDLNLSIEKNKSIAFVGESGSGKTTLVNLISGLYYADEGNLFIDRQKIKDLNSESYQKRIGYISQEPVVFNDTVFNNVTFWAEPTKENKDRFYAAIKQASVHHFIDGLPKKENTLLGNNGVNLSGGQKQRISIARELYKDIDILILDEATSALDSETEKAIQENIDVLKGKYTILIIAHRLSTIKNADTIYLLDKGKITAKGDFDQLCALSDKFKRMVELQEI